MRSVGVSIKMVLPSALINIFRFHIIHLLFYDTWLGADNFTKSQFDFKHSVSTKLPPTFTHSMHILKANNDILQLISPIRNVVFADSSGFYDTISTMLSSPVCIPFTKKLTFKIDHLLTNGDSFNIFSILQCLPRAISFNMHRYFILVEFARHIRFLCWYLCCFHRVI